MDLATSEAVVRVTVFAASLALFAVVEAVSPRRRRTVARRRRWTGNLGLVVVDTILVRAVPFLSAVAMAGLAETQGWGLLRTLGPLPIAVSIGASVVLLDLAVYAQHRLFHTLPVLWWVHRVHHTDPELDATTGVRFHPVEIMLSATFKVAVVGVLGAPIVGVIVFEIVLNAGSLWSHANLRLPASADRLLRMVLVTPDMHRVHHSVDPVELNRNFGFTLSWWDRLFGTYRAQPAMGHEAMSLGVAGFHAPDVLSLGLLLIQPLRRESDPLHGTICGTRR